MGRYLNDRIKRGRDDILVPHDEFSHVDRLIIGKPTPTTLSSYVPVTVGRITVQPGWK